MAIESVTKTPLTVHQSDDVSNYLDTETTVIPNERSECKGSPSSGTHSACNQQSHSCHEIPYIRYAQ